MLAGYGAPPSLAGWVVEPKLDGWRAMVSVVDGRVSVRTRRGRDLAVSELQPLADLGLDLLLDGELVAGAGRMSDFYGLAPALARRHRPPSLAFVAFDLLRCQGHDLTQLPYDSRRSLLERLELPPPVTVVRAWDADEAVDLLAACEQLGVEGVVLKRRSAPYTPGKRSTSWRKVKCEAWREHAGRRGPRA